jgi:hypothetical protein
VQNHNDTNTILDVLLKRTKSLLAAFEQKDFISLINEAMLLTLCTKLIYKTKSTKLEMLIVRDRVMEERGRD